MGTVAKIAIYAIEFLFAFGIIGSAIVVFLTSIEDSEVFFSRNDEPAATNHSAQSQSEQERQF